MLDEVYTWLEEYAGTSYDFTESMQEINGNRAFITPFDWRIGIETVLNQLDEAIDTVDEFWPMIPPTLPERTELKRLISQTTLGEIVKNINSVCSQLNIDAPEIKTIDKLKDVVITLWELIDMLVNHDLQEILKSELFEKHEEENDDSFTNLLNIRKQDMTQLSYNVSSIRQAYFESLDDEDESLY